MPRPVASVTEPVQLHAEALQVEHGGRVLRMAAQQPHGGETKTLASGRQRMQVIGVRAAQADDALSAGLARRRQMRGELEPLVAGDQRVDLVQAQDRHLDPGLGQPVEVQGLQGCAGQPVEGSRKRHGWGGLEGVRRESISKTAESPIASFASGYTPTS